eukprot:2639387-Heterocapsa_arctica.AAC.1
MEKPTLTASSADRLLLELKRFKTVLNDAKCFQKSRWFSVARAVAEGKAKVALETFILCEIGGEDAYQAALRRPDDLAWPDMWSRFEAKLKHVGRLEVSSDLDDAIHEYDEVALGKGSTPSQVEVFLDDYARVRVAMIAQ